MEECAWHRDVHSAGKRSIVCVKRLNSLSFMLTACSLISCVSSSRYSDMSGIEILGLVLGGILSVISGKHRLTAAKPLQMRRSSSHPGLEHYEEGVRTIRLIWWAPTVFHDLERRMQVEGILLRNSIEHLLRVPSRIQYLRNSWTDNEKMAYPVQPKPWSIY